MHEERNETSAATLGNTGPGPAAPDFDARSAIFLAITNAFTLCGALLLTRSIALTVRVPLPRHLGPALFGELSFADAFTATLFVVPGLGTDFYIRKVRRSTRRAGFGE